MISSIITIAAGLIVAFMLPEAVKLKDKTSRTFIHKLLLIVGCIITLSGIFSLFKSF